MSGEQATIREHLEALIAETEGWKIEHEPILQHAVAALAILDGQQWEVWLAPCLRAWHPLRLDQAQRHCTQHGCGEPVRGRFVPDPGAGSSLPGAPRCPNGHHWAFADAAFHCTECGHVHGTPDPEAGRS